MAWTTDLDTTLQHLEEEARQLGEVDAHLDALSQVSEYARKFLIDLPNQPAFTQSARHPAFDQTLPDLPQPFAEVLAEFDQETLLSGINATSSRFFGYVPGGGLPSSALGDYLAAITNRYGGVYYASPGAAEMENTMIRWLRDMVGFPDAAWGTLQSGGSLSTLTAVVAARETRPQSDWQKSVVYLTRECHHAVHKALHIAGLAHLPSRYVAVDRQYKMDVDDLVQLVTRDREAGLIPWLVFATAGTINTGAVDPLSSIGDVCRRENLWFHIDAAYGGFFALCASQKKELQGLSKADSLVLDPHKGLFLPYGCGVVLVRDGKTLKKGFAYQSDYLADVHDEAVASPSDFSPELTRHFRAVRLWLSLKVHGLKRFRAALDEKLLLAQYIYDRLSKDQRLLMGPEPQLSCTTFCVAGSSCQPDDKATQQLLDKILQNGRIHLSSTRLGGHLFLRICVLSFRSHKQDLDEVWSTIDSLLLQE